ncbi:MAG: mandelate racemase/muconate lactonizing enzyme family protein [Alphaproteobacteria bacterium]|nr:mandelate racemase/muconate lactonizing enzyme family protein [Alphaproteobacteria bacterium]
MKIAAITTYVVKAGKRYEIGGGSRDGEALPDSGYFRFHPYPHLYSQRSEALVVRVDTTEGVSGWGEAQAPIAPEVAETIVRLILAPVVLGRPAVETNSRYIDMYEAMRVRGHGGGFYVDAIAAIDTALWDIRARAAGLSLSTAIGGRLRERLPCYASGLRRPTAEERTEEAKAHVGNGISGLKLFLGHGLERDAEAIALIRAAVGPRVRLFVDALWRYDYPSAVRLGRICEQHKVDFLESPLLPDDIEGHANLARELDVAIAVGEALRTRFQFTPWLQRGAIDICQPDVMRNGVSEACKIAVLAESLNKPVAYHTGCTTAIGLAATYHLAAAIPNFYIQEYQPVMLDTFNAWLKEPIRLSGGEIVVPSGPGLGIELDEERMRRDVVSMSTVTLKS